MGIFRDCSFLAFRLFIIFWCPVQYSFKQPLHLNKYGIPEPNKKVKVYPDILIVPLVAFDKDLYRIGYGGGYYDRYIAKLKKKKYFITIGFAYSFQIINKVPINKFDKNLDFIITENKVYKWSYCS